MRTLKKTLCFALALVMILGLGVFSVAAAEEGVEEKYTEAVDVTSAVGIFQGGSGVDWTTNLTRGQAATLLCRLDGANEDTLPAGASYVDADWADKYINYAEGMGYVKGYGNGYFGTNDPLTGYQWSLMLLRVLGYKDENEGINGDNFKVVTAKLARQAGLDSGVTNGDTALNRQQAAQFCLNALKATMVQYTGGTTIDVNGATITQGAVRGNVPDPATLDYNSTNDALTLGLNGQEATLQLAEKLYPNKLELTTVAAGGTDESGRPANVWTYPSAATIVSAASVTAVTSFTAETTAANVATALKGYTLDGNKVENSTKYTTGTLASSYSLNGANATGFTYGIAAGQTIAAAIAGLTANGTLVEIYANSNNEITTIVEIDYTRGKVSNISTASNGNVTYTISGTQKIDYADDDTYTDTIEVNGAIAKDDYVTYFEDAAGKWHVYPTTTFTGVQTAKNTDGVITIEGKTYEVSAAASAEAASYYNNSSETHKYWLDQYGFLVYGEKVEETAQYAVVTAIANAAASGTSSTNKITANLVLADGTKVEGVEISKINGDTAATIGNPTTAVNGNTGTNKVNANTGANGAFTNKIVTYKLDGEKYEIRYPSVSAIATADGLTYADDTQANSGTTLISKGVPALGKDSGTAITANSNTVYLIASTSGTSTVYKSYTGFANVGSVKANGGALTAQSVTKDSKVAFIYVDATSNATLGDTVTQVFYTADNAVATTGTGTTADPYIYTMDGILNGEKATIKSKTADFEVASSAVPSTKTFYDLTVTDDGFVTNAASHTFTNTSAYVANEATVTAVSADKVVGSYLYDSSTVVYVINGSDVSTGSPDDLAIGDGYHVNVYTTGDSTKQNTIEKMYIVKNEFGSASITATAAATLAGTGTMAIDTTASVSGSTVTVYIMAGAAASGDQIAITGAAVSGSGTTVATSGSAGNNLVVRYDGTDWAVKSGTLTATSTSGAITEYTVKVVDTKAVTAAAAAGDYTDDDSGSATYTAGTPTYSQASPIAINLHGTFSSLANDDTLVVHLTLPTGATVAATSAGDTAAVDASAKTVTLTASSGMPTLGITVTFADGTTQAYTVTDSGS